MDVLSSRELATVIWVAAFIGLALWKGALRGFGKVVNAIRPLLVIYFVCVFLYVSLAVAVLHAAGAWDQSQLKNTLIWLLFVAPASAGRALSRDKPAFFRIWMADNLKILVIAEFLLSHYTFTLWVELLLVPLTTLLVGMSAMATKEPSHQRAKALVDGVLSAIGIVLIGRSLVLAASDLAGLASISAAQDLYVQPLLSLAFLPFLYGAYVYAAYDRVFKLLVVPIKDEDLRSFARHRACQAFGPNIPLLNLWFWHVSAHTPANAADIEALIKEVWASATRRKYPRAIAFDEGWCPYRAMAFLKAHELVPEAYRRAYDGTYFSTATRSLEAEFPAHASLSYNIDGTAEVATLVQLDLFVTKTHDHPAADAEFFRAAVTLLSTATNIVASDDADALRFGPNAAFCVTAGPLEIELSHRKRGKFGQNAERNLTLRHRCHADPRS